MGLYSAHYGKWFFSSHYFDYGENLTTHFPPELSRRNFSKNFQSYRRSWIYLFPCDFRGFFFFFFFCAKRSVSQTILWWRNVLLGGQLQIHAKTSNFEIFEDALNMKSWSMSLTKARSVVPLLFTTFNKFLVDGWPHLSILYLFVVTTSL